MNKHIIDNSISPVVRSTATHMNYSLQQLEKYGIICNDFKSLLNPAYLNDFCYLMISKDEFQVNKRKESNPQSEKKY